MLPTLGMTDKDPNQGEGDRASARRYDKHVEDYVAQGKVDDAARGARDFVERHPNEAEHDERQAKGGPRSWATADELVAKGHTLLERLRLAVDRMRARIARH